VLDGVHAQPITAVDQRISPCELGHKRLIEVWLDWEVQFGYTSFGDDAAVVRLDSCLVHVVTCDAPEHVRVRWDAHIHDRVISLCLQRAPTALPLFLLWVAALGTCLPYHRHGCWKLYFAVTEGMVDSLVGGLMKR
jgi:hypothetical protein